ncbi:MAG: hypothetical protein WD988_01640 [Candidatus Curtissbacteria bacterium]
MENENTETFGYFTDENNGHLVHKQFVLTRDDLGQVVRNARVETLDGSKVVPARIHGRRVPGVKRRISPKPTSRG